MAMTARVGVWVLGTDRSNRRLVLYVVFSYMALILLHTIALGLWLFWLVILLLLQLLLWPCQPSRTFFRDFVRETVCSGYLEWLCRWDVRVRNVYAVKLYVEPTLPVDLQAHFGIAALTLYLIQLPYSTCQPYDYAFDTATRAYVAVARDCHYAEWSIALVLPVLLHLRLVAWCSVRMCEICIVPIFRPSLATYQSLVDVNGCEDAPLRLRPTAPCGEDTLGITTVAYPMSTYCIPVPQHGPEPPLTPLPLLESPPSKQTRASASPAFGLRRRRTSNEATAEMPRPNRKLSDNDEVSTSDMVLQRLCFVKKPIQAVDRAYDAFDGSYQAPPAAGAFPGVNLPQGSASTRGAATTQVNYDKLSPTNRQSQSFQLPRVSRAIDDSTISARSLSTIDPVHFSAFCPPVVRTSVFTFSIWAFLVHQRDEMREEATTLNDDGAKQLSREVLMHVRRGARVHVTLSVPEGFRLLDAATKPLEWDGHVTHVSYNVQGQAIVDGQVLFAASIVLGAQVMRLRSYVFASSKPVKEKQDDDEAGPVEVTASSLEMLPETYEEIAYDELEMKNLVGRGNFGDAYRARYRGQDVVVKTLRPSEFGDNQDQIVQEFRHEAASDVYSFGVLIWETYHGVGPFAGLSGAEAAARVLSGDRLALSTAIPLHLQDLVTQCFRDDPSKRPSMAQVLMALD
ncbi:hypothetical protein SPRG_21897 [Saprolegnia parasitica CBS 223.65]|uniref:Tyrosine-protein kinase catalytic domain-containing protein n=1 Tax=Saprolegnia parasitica (strain CBS 223.65) TaxID=695850 RepID=A0A067BSF9_SAPPC|nr:hypothetical protein SPRG_21897 [Saprolegnia parasitica CBS 223.65]KDO17201.1 hypothetical protein SPRG_21897 [Saprolegnia parasitica CBS 223.65]|eukprot:XP_012212090.1 hypothetical protein SPRG_21897 [Saprolegnia parasitica CBS 223.65]